MTQRKSLSQKVRFEVFKRDSFTCQYCGSKAPDIILEVDHLKPVSKGGKNEILNLVTSCFDCNRGKSNRVLSDMSIVEKQRVQIEELNLRRQQLEMILQWKEGLLDLKDEETNRAAEYFSKNTEFCLNEFGINNLKAQIKKFGLVKILEAFDISKQKYYIGDAKSFELAIKKTYAIAYLNSQPPHLTKIAYAKGILNNRIYVNHSVAQDLMKKYWEQGYDMEHLISYCKIVKNWTSFVEWISEIINDEEPF